MPASGKRFSDHIIGLLASLTYHIALFCIRMSKVPVIGWPVGMLIGGRNLRVVTVPLDLKLQSESAILPFDAVRRLVESSSFIVGLDACMCRESLDCKDYPVDLGCLFLGEGARTIHYKGVREFTKDEALDRLERAKRLGLVNNIIWSSGELKLLGADANRTIELCSCCPCCCLMFKTRDASKAFVDSFKGFGVCKVIAADECTHCTNCESACPFKAIHVDFHIGPSVDESRCKGCGRCEMACKPEVLKVFPLYARDGKMAQKGIHKTDAEEQFDWFLSMVR